MHLYDGFLLLFFFNATPTTEFYTLSLHDALPILFHRLGKRMVPTPAGERLLVAARRALPQLSDVEEELRRLAGGRAAILRVSTECYTCYHWLPGVLQPFARRFPQVDVQIVAEANHLPVPALFDGRIALE